MIFTFRQHSGSGLLHNTPGGESCRKIRTAAPKGESLAKLRYADRLKDSRPDGQFCKFGSGVESRHAITDRLRFPSPARNGSTGMKFGKNLSRISARPAISGEQMSLYG